MLFLSCLFLSMAFPAAGMTGPPTVGAQIWIERGQSPEQIDAWFKILAELNMPLTRLFIMWDVVEIEPDHWEFALYDVAFAAAQKYGVKVVATLSPTHAPLFRGGVPASQNDEMPETWEALHQQRIYIEKAVNRYKDHPALYAWMQQNEPGRPHNTGALTADRFRKWLLEKYGTIDRLNRAWHHWFSSFDEIQFAPHWQEYGWRSPAPWYDWRTFGQEHLTWYMQWIADEIRRHDADTPLHLNPHGLVGNLIFANYRLHDWRPMLQSLGASIHPAWHFGLLQRIQYTLGVSYVCDLVRGAAEPDPFWVTELQAGNNIYSGAQPYCPSPEDIAQWMWTSVGTGAENIIFWLLNQRAQGNEAGEWSMLDFDGRPTDRLLEASHIARILNGNRDFFADARPRLPNITVLYSYRTMMQQARTRASYSGLGRDANAHSMAVLGVYKALAELGIPPQLKEIDDFDWEGVRKPHFLILPHLTMITREQADRLVKFMRKGRHQLLVTDLTGLYDEREAVGRFPFVELFGARLKEFRVVGFDRAEVTAAGAALPFHMWKGTLYPESGKPIGGSETEPAAVRNQDGRAVWIPSAVALGAWLYDSEPLSRLLRPLADEFLNGLYALQLPKANVTIRQLAGKRSDWLIIANRNEEPAELRFTSPPLIRRVIFGNGGLQRCGDGSMIIRQQQTVVLECEK